MRSWKVVVGALIVGGWMLPAGVSEAQELWPYRPARPTMSPYMGFLQRDTGPTGTYLSIVRPQVQLQQSLGRQQYVLRRQATAINVLEQSMLPNEPGRQQVPITGTGGTFMQYSHYYPGLTNPPVRR